MGLIHHLSDSLVVASFKGVADVEDPLNLSDNILGSEEVFFGNLGANLIQPYSLGVAEEFYLRMVLPYRRSSILAGSAALVVGAGSEFMLDAGIDQDEFIALRIEGEVLVFEGFAVEANESS